MEHKIKNAISYNQITTPLTDKPDYSKVGIIKAVWNNKKFPVAKITYEHFWNEEFQYIIEPYWSQIDWLRENYPKAFHGIPGIDLSCHYQKYIRANRTPAFIIQRTPPKNRADVMELMEEVGLNYYDPFEWLLRTNSKASQDNLILEKE